MIQLANYEERTFYVVLGQIVTSCDVKFIFQMTEEEFDVTLTPVTSTERATKFAFTATGYPEGQYIVTFLETGRPAGNINVLATTSAFVTGNPIFATSQYNTYNDDGTSTTYVPSDDQGLVPSVSQKLRVSTVDLGTDVSYVRYLKVTNGTLTDNGDNSVTINTSGVDTLEALTDVYIENLDNNQIIQYQSFSLPGNPAGWKNRVLQLASLNDTKGIPSDGQFLVYTGGFWQPYSLSLPSPPPSNTDGLPEGTVNLYYTEARVSANSDVAANTAKVGITAQQAADILNNNAKVGITAQQASDITTNNAKVSLIAGGATGQALVKTSGTDYDVEWADISIDVQYHNRYATESETLRAGGAETIELYYSAQADGDGLAESASSDTPTAGYDIRRKLYYSEAGFADPDTGTWTQFTAIADNTTFNNAKAALLAYLKERTGGTVPISLKMTWEEVSQTAYLLDQSYGSGAEAAYSTRQLRNAATDCMVIRRASDSTTTTIGFDGSGNIDESAIETFCTGTTCTVVTWKDQSGNGNDLTGGSGVEPTIYTGGAMVKNNGKASLSFAAGDFMSDTGWNGASNSYIFNLLQSNGSESSPRIGVDVGSTTEYYGLGIDGNSGASYAGIGGIAQTSNGTAIAATRDAMWDAMQSQNILTISGDFSSWTGGFGLSRSGQKMYTFAQEFIIYNADKSSHKTSIESNIGDYFTQNTPLLDTYSGAAAAYSLRLLDSSYVGSAVEVYNGSSYADIGFNVFGELDTVALAAHCGSNDGFVSKWYDQSGNSNDATQTTTANMPKIYDGTTGVVTENGKPAVEFLDNADSLFSTSATAFNSVLQNELYCVASYGTINVGNQYAAGVQIGGSTRGVMIGTNSSGDDIRYHCQGNGFETATGGTISVDTQILHGGTYDGTTRHARLNGASVGTNTDAEGTGTADVYFIGKHPSLAAGTDKKVQEFIIYASYNGNEANIEDNINTFYNIY